MISVQHIKRLSERAFILCIIACTGDLITSFIFPLFYPGYHPLSQTISAMGIASSPIGREISWSWIILGMLFVVFAFTYYKSAEAASHQRKAAWLIAVYGICDVFGSGAFPGVYHPGHLSLSETMHYILGAAGTLAIFVLPFFYMTRVNRKNDPLFFAYLKFVVFTGVTLWFFFVTARLQLNWLGWAERLVGLWQRSFQVNYYVFLMVIAFRHYYFYNSTALTRSFNIPSIADSTRFQSGISGEPKC
jgi:hypothetical protein